MRKGRESHAPRVRLILVKYVKVSVAPKDKQSKLLSSVTVISIHLLQGAQ